MFRTLRCIGMYEHVDKFVFVFEHPMGGGQPFSLYDFLSLDNKYSPSVTARMKLALYLARTVHQIHTAGWLHKNLRSENILFFPPPHAVPNWASIAEPFLAGFGYARIDAPSEISERPSVDSWKDIYRHPSALGDPSTKFNKLMDIYAFGTIPVELAEWHSLEKILQDRKKLVLSKDTATEEITRVMGYLLHRNLAFRMGDIYSKVAMDCLSGRLWDETEIEGDGSALVTQTFYNNVVCELERCLV
jgi:serine/threonine protein kinase